MKIHFFCRADNEPSVMQSTGSHCKNQYTHYTDSEKQFLLDHWQTMSNLEIAERIGRSRISVQSMGTELGLKRTPEALNLVLSRQWNKRINGKEVAWKADEILFLKDNYQTMTIREIALKLNRPIQGVKAKAQRDLRLRKTPEAISNIAKRPNGGQFKKGQSPANTIFGDEMIIRVRRNKAKQPYKWIRIGFKKWQEYHRWMWIRDNGPIPKGHLVVFQNGNTLDVRSDNLELITMAENALRNSGSVNLPDGYVAHLMAVRKPELKQELLKHADLIDLKRTEIHLKRAIKHYDNAKPAKTR